MMQNIKKSHEIFSLMIFKISLNCSEMTYMINMINNNVVHRKMLGILFVVQNIY